MQSLTLHIDGMTCQGCVNSVRNALSALPVAHIDIRLADKRATLQYDAAHTSPEAIIAAIEAAGFDARA